MTVSAVGFAVDANDSFLLRFAAKPLVQRILRHPYADMQRMEREVRASGLDWTIIRPARLTNRGHTGRYRTALNENVSDGWSISRADLADYIVRHLADPGLSRSTVAIAY